MGSDWPPIYGPSFDRGTPPPSRRAPPSPGAFFDSLRTPASTHKLSFLGVWGCRDPPAHPAQPVYGWDPRTSPNFSFIIPSHFPHSDDGRECMSSHGGPRRPTTRCPIGPTLTPQLWWVASPHSAFTLPAPYQLGTFGRHTVWLNSGLAKVSLLSSDLPPLINDALVWPQTFPVASCLLQGTIPPPPPRRSPPQRRTRIGTTRTVTPRPPRPRGRIQPGRCWHGRTLAHFQLPRGWMEWGRGRVVIAFPPFPPFCQFALLCIFGC